MKLRLNIPANKESYIFPGILRRDLEQLKKKKLIPEGLPTPVWALKTRGFSNRQQDCNFSLPSGFRPTGSATEDPEVAPTDEATNTREPDETTTTGEPDEATSTDDPNEATSTGEPDEATSTEDPETAPTDESTSTEDPNEATSTGESNEPTTTGDPEAEESI